MHPSRSIHASRDIPLRPAASPCIPRHSSAPRGIRIGCESASKPKQPPKLRLDGCFYTAMPGSFHVTVHDFDKRIVQKLNVVIADRRFDVAPADAAVVGQKHIRSTRYDGQRPHQKLGVFIHAT